MKRTKILIAVVLAVALLGCGKREPRHIVILPDVSGSIDRESLEQAFKAIDELAGHLYRGDTLTIIPILSDAEAEVSGRIVRFQVPTNRQAYDTDLRDLRIKLNSSLKEMRANALAHPGTKTDVLGSIALAEQEFQVDIKSQKVFLILSDFIQEDNEIDFMKDTHLVNAPTAKDHALHVAKRKQVNFKGVMVYLGLLRSNEYSYLTRSRREAIFEFWATYFQCAGTRARIKADGLGILRTLR